MGVAYFNLGLLTESVAELEQAARLMPENENIQLQLATAYVALVEQGESAAFDKALTRIDRALLLHPNMRGALLLKSSLYRSLKGKSFQKMQTVWREIAAIDEDAARRQMAEFLQEHKALLASAPQFLERALAALVERGGRLFPPPGTEERVPSPSIWVILGSLIGVGPLEETRQQRWRQQVADERLEFKRLMQHEYEQRWQQELARLTVANQEVAAESIDEARYSLIYSLLSPEQQQIEEILTGKVLSINELFNMTAFVGRRLAEAIPVSVEKL